MKLEFSLQHTAFSTSHIAKKKEFPYNSKGSLAFIVHKVLESVWSFVCLSKAKANTITVTWTNALLKSKSRWENIIELSSELTQDFSKTGCMY